MCVSYLSIAKGTKGYLLALCISLSLAHWLVCLFVTLLLSIVKMETVHEVKGVSVESTKTYVELDLKHR